MNTILIAVLVVAVIGLIIGLVLAIASIVMAVPKNEKAEAVLEVLPGVNCGACGYSGCAGYAEALANYEAEANLCAPGGAEVATAVSQVLGVEVGSMVRTSALVQCMGTCENTEKSMEYQGVSSCSSAVQLYGGTGKCNYGCMGFGDCKSACEYDAIELCNGIAVINPNMCKACKKCVTACPKNIITMVEVKKVARVLCSNKDKGGITRKACKVGCIGCMKCVKTCPVNAIKVENFLARIDENLCTGCEECTKVCPQHCIVIQKVCVRYKVL